jgi:glycine dehydrogenase subunit 1
MKTYVEGLGEVTVQEFNPATAQETFSALDPKQVACVIIQQPNYFGNLEDITSIQQFCQTSGALFIVAADPISLGILTPPGDYGADIVVGDIQPLGNNLAYGGPYGGFMATKEKYIRQLPGRLVGRSIDKTGRPCFTLTLQTREQHIRREKATSNICTNQALNVLKATVYLTLVGPQGLKHIANVSVQRAHALAEQLTTLPGVKLLFPNQPFFSEFIVLLPVSTDIALKHLEKHRILGGISLSKVYPEYPNSMLISVTEMTTPTQINQYVEALQTLLNNQSTVKELSLEACPR